MADQDGKEDLKALMRAALDRKNSPHDATPVDEAHHKQKAPAERGRQGGSSMFRRKAGG